MRRWNEWGAEGVTYPLKQGLISFLEREIGPGHPWTPVPMESVKPPPSALPSHPLVATDDESRIRHALGQSLADVIRLWSGAIPAFPDGVAYPLADEDVETLIRFALETDSALIPYGGGTSVVGGINPPPDRKPILTVDMSRMMTLEALDAESHLATFGAGVTGPRLEAQLRAHGFTLGHFPQSFEFSTLGGWIATRSSGQQSLGYGHIEDLFAGGRVITPVGLLELPPFPDSAAGPDLRQLILGSEGRLGVITQATVRIRPVPRHESFFAALFPNWDSGLAAMREIAQERLPLSMMRLSNGAETRAFIAISGIEERFPGPMKAIKKLLGGDEMCLFLFAIGGTRRKVRAGRIATQAAIRRHKGLSIGRSIGERWRKDRFRTPYMRRSLLERGWGVETAETAVPWSRVTRLMKALETALRDALNDEGERVYPFTHLSHSYNDGAAVYTTFIFRLGRDADTALARWEKLKTTACRVITSHGGTISHHHGVGTYHLPYMEAEKGKPGMEALRAVASALDPAGIMNPGKMLPW